eukprot:SM000190S04840  [mRNA]  locus=s190:27194:33886:+ [translate_table: standard]
MAAEPPARPLAPGPDSIFRLPAGFFNGADLWRNEQASPSPPAAPSGEEVAAPPPAPPPEDVAAAGFATAVGGGSEEAPPSAQRLTCHACGAAFAAAAEQRAHFRTDWHRLNVKRRLAQKRPLSEDEFEELVSHAAAKRPAGLDNSDVSSISGSEDELSGDEAQDGMGVAPTSSKKPHVFFVLRNSGQPFAISRVLLAGPKEDVTEEEMLKRLRLLTDSTKAGGNASGRLWTVLLSTGGHFAAVVMDPAGGGVVAHQTFHRFVLGHNDTTPGHCGGSLVSLLRILINSDFMHLLRYVVRAKAGGRQSAKDAMGKSIKSAGSSLRRYNEAALEKEILELLDSWQAHLTASMLIFVHAPSSNARVLFGGDRPPLAKADPRLRPVPFTVRRPTLKEAKRVAEALARVEYDVDGLAALDRERHSADAYARAALAGRAEQLKQALRKSRVRDQGQAVNAAAPSTAAVEEAVTAEEASPLHRAAAEGDEVLVGSLLEEGADPTVHDARGRTPYVVAREKAVRNVFRRFMAANEGKWDWHAAEIPSPLTEEQEAAQAAKKAEKDAKRRAKEKERKKERQAHEKACKAAAAEAAAREEVQHGKAKTVASKEDIAKAMDEAKRRERDMRAAAAERRLSALELPSGQPSGSGHTSQAPAAAGGPDSAPERSDSSHQLSGGGEVCDCCSASMVGRTPFHRLQYKYCSTTCVRVHRLALEEGTGVELVVEALEACRDVRLSDVW